MSTIKKFKSKGFRRLTDFEILFSSGLNIIKSPNEGGKSSLLKALLEIFYGDATSTKREILSHRSWNNTDDDEFFIEVELADSQCTYIVTRDFQQKENFIRLPNGGTHQDKKTIQEKLGELVGFPSLKGYLATACIMQEDLRQAGKGASELQSLIEQRLLHGARLEEILRELDRENKDLEKGGGKDPGPIKRMEKELRELSERRNNLDDTLRKASLKREKLEGALTQIKELEKRKSETEATLARLRKYQEERESYNLASKSWDDANKTMKRREDEDKNLTKDRERLEGVKREATLCRKKIRLYELQEDLSELEKIRKEIDSIEGQLARMPQIDETDFRNGMRIPGEIDSLKSSFRKQKDTVKGNIERVRNVRERKLEAEKLLGEYRIRLEAIKKNLEYLRFYKQKEEIHCKIRTLEDLAPEMEVTVLPQKSLPLRVRMDGKTAYDGEAKTVIRESAKKEFGIFIEGVVDIEVVQKGAEAIKLLEEREKLQSSIESIDNTLQGLGGYAVPPDSFLATEKDKMAVGGEIKNLELKIKGNEVVIEEGKRNIQDGRRGWNEIFGEIHRKKTELQKIFSHYRVQSLQELETHKKSYENLQLKKREKDTEYRNRLDDRTVELMKEELSSLTDELKKEGQQLILTPEESKEAKIINDNLHGTLRDLEKGISEREGVLKTLEAPDVLEEKKNEAIKAMAVSEAKTEELGFQKNTLRDGQFYQESIAKKANLESELKELNPKISELYKRKNFLDGSLADQEKDSESVVKLEEEIASKEKELERHRRKLQSNRVLLESLREARERTLNTIPQTLSQRAGQYISHITSDRYSRVEMKIKEGLNLRVYSDEKGDWIDINEKSTELSTGILDQIYFATRLALIEVVAQRQHPPILMDDPFVFFDSDRREKALQVLERLSQHFQILVFTCHDYPCLERYSLNQEVLGIKVLTPP